jgi:formate/nitrite transporter
MEVKNYFMPSEIVDVAIATGIKKVSTPYYKEFVLAILAGAFIAFASEGSNMAAYNLLANPETFGLGKALAGAIFGTGLMMVIVAGAEMFTGQTLIVAAVMDKKVKIPKMLINWVLVWIGNLVGGLLLAYMMHNSGLFNSSAGLLGGMTIKIAAYKTSLPFMSAFWLGVMCNWLVCLAVWMSFAAKDITGKLLAIFFPIWLFITSGFEHSVANMYYIPAGIFAKSNPKWVQAAMDHGVTQDMLNDLNWTNFFLVNELPVTLGNIVGGGLLVAGVYWFVYKQGQNKVHDSKQVVKIH